MAVAPVAQAVEMEIGAPLVPNRSARASPTEPKRKRVCMAEKSFAAAPLRMSV
jgi:hypothetical protein